MLDDAHHHDQAGGTRASLPRRRAAAASLMLDALTDPLAYGFFQRSLVAAIIVGPRVLGRRHVHGPARPGVHGRRDQPLGVPGRRRRVPAQGPVLPRRRRSRPSGRRWPSAGSAGAATSAATPSIGVLFAGMFSLGVFLFSTIRNYVGDLFGFLFGEVLGISPTDLLALSVLAVVVLVDRGACSGRSSSTRPSTRSAPPRRACPSSPSTTSSSRSSR